MKPDHEQPDDYRQRRGERLAVSGSARLRGPRYSVEVQIRDVSQTGFMAECADRVRIGSYVSLEVPGIGTVRAQVRWQIGGRMGGMFVDPISLNKCAWTAVRTDDPTPA